MLSIVAASATLETAILITGGGGGEFVSEKSTIRSLLP